MSKWMKELSKMDGAVENDYNPFAFENMLRSPSPSLNYIFGKGGGIPYGYTVVLFGPPKAGKSLVSNLFVGQMHKDDKEAIAIKFNTEMRESAQMADYWGIDADRYQAYNVNEPEKIFDRIHDEILPMLEAGMPLKLIIIDSLQGIQGMREAHAESVTDHQIGDHAMVIQKGLKRILPTLRKHKVALVCTAHIRANQDAGKYGPKEKMAGGFAQKHFFEYFVEVKRDGASESRSDLLGEKFEADVKDFRDNKEKTAHKIYVRMEDSSLGKGTGRSGEFTLSYEKGLINTHEEIFLLATNLKLVERPNNRTYIYDNIKYSSKEEFLIAIRDNKSISDGIMKLVHDRDL